MAKQKCVLAYSGGLDTSVMIQWLIDTFDCEVIAVCGNLGQKDELEGLEEKALKTGAVKAYIEDLQEEYITDYIYPVLKAGAVYENKYLLGTSHGRPLIAKRMVEIARKEGATMVAHGATGKGNDQVRFELTFMALAPDLTIISPWKDDRWTLTSREECIEYAEAHNIPLTVSKEKIYSEDANIWHISHEGGELEDPGNEPLDTVYTKSTLLEEAPDTPEYVEIDFEKGVPVGIDGERMSSALALVEKLNNLGAKHAIGQIDIVENRLVGIKSRGVYETPGGTILYAAHQNLEELTLDRDTFHEKQKLALTYADLVYDGKWFTPLREAIDAFVDSTQESVTGKVRLKLYKGNIVPAGAWSKNSLYVDELASFDDVELYDQKDAGGFIRCFGLPMKVEGMRHRKEL
ncbi:argininosuccinate synthase [Chitinivibrio alkaliphilus]|uniref:Argininosuccinate synthase n=1 Tax=Chitinivibrio alkaliphilus ACht1 TaxID=1313304 RepID=U7D8L5_9BACT|nr:argininosuccinate synthase [Chitinivibrio alkaliphilus]ERP31432.1 Argininosuccinate synthase [Chitinivibrio alkaliphilus ACht1]